MASFFDEIARNRLKSLLLMAVFVALFAGIIYLLVWLLGGGIGWFFIGLVLVLIYALLVFMFGDALQLRMAKAQPADPKQYASLYSIVEGIAAASQVPMPKVYIVNDPNPNAFASGRNKKVSSISVTTGLLSMMEKRELQGVIAHEMSHIANADVQFMMIAIIFAGAIGLVAAVIRNVFLFGGLNSRGRNGRRASSCFWSAWWWASSPPSSRCSFVSPSPGAGSTWPMRTAHA